MNRNHTWNPEAHPRELSGAFAEKAQTAPEALLPGFVEARSPYVEAREVLLGSDKLWSADAEVERKSGVAEVSDATAAVLAESILQRLPDGYTREDFHWLTLAARSPENFGRESHAVVDEMHRELGSIYDRLQPAQRPRADALFTWALHGPND